MYYNFNIFYNIINMNLPLTLKYGTIAILNIEKIIYEVNNFLMKNEL